MGRAKKERAGWDFAIYTVSKDKTKPRHNWDTFELTYKEYVNKDDLSEEEATNRRLAKYHGFPYQFEVKHFPFGIPDGLTQSLHDDGPRENLAYGDYFYDRRIFFKDDYFARPFEGDEIEVGFFNDGCVTIPIRYTITKRNKVDPRPKTYYEFINLYKK